MIILSDIKAQIECLSQLGEPGRKWLPKMLGAMEGEEQAYMDVLAAVFGSHLLTGLMHPKFRN